MNTKEFICKKSIMWNHVTTRIMGLLEIWQANGVYPSFPVKGGLPLDTIIIGENGQLKRYVDQEQLNALEQAIQESEMSPILRKYQDYEKSILSIFKKDPFENRKEYMKISDRLWIHEIVAFFTGLFTKDKETVELVSSLRGTENAQHIAISKFLPKLFKQIAKKTGIDTDLLKYAIPEEIVSLKLDPDILQKRKEMYVLEQIDGKKRLLIEGEAKKYIEKFSKEFNETIDESITEFKGSTAFAGKVSGKVVIVNIVEELKNVKEGDILVSPMTRTSFLPAMKIASAFLTDEGGVTCHAAIMAREMKKPCVVGTKIASKLLKNGDMIEVDANEGVVKILKRK